MLAAIESSSASGLYQIGQYLHNLRPDWLDGLPRSVRQRVNALAELLMPSNYLIDAQRTVPALQSAFEADGDLLTQMPTTGMQAVAVGVLMGFKDIYLAGIDLYQHTGSRHGVTLPDSVKQRLDERHVVGGYDAKAHSMEWDLAYLERIRAMAPDVTIRHLCPDSPAVGVFPLAPVLGKAPEAAAAPWRKSKPAGWDAGIRAAQKTLESLSGEIDEVRPTLVRGWALNPAAPKIPVSVDIRLGEDLLGTTAADGKADRLAWAGLSDGTGEFQFTPDTPIPVRRIKDLRVVVRETGVDLGRPKVVLFDRLRKDAPPPRPVHAPAVAAASASGIEVIVPPAFRRLLVLGHDFSGLTGIGRSVSDYARFMRTRAGIDVTVHQVSGHDDRSTIAALIGAHDHTLFESIGVFTNHPFLIGIAEGIPPGRASLYMHETGYVMAALGANNPSVAQAVGTLLGRIHVLCVSRRQQAWLREAFGTRRSDVVYETVPPLPHYAGTVQPRSAVVMVGSQQARKGLELFSRVADIASVEAPELSFEWIGPDVGDPSGETAYRSPHVAFRGELQGPALFQAVKSAEAVLLSSSDDPFPLVALESLQMGKRLALFAAIGSAEVMRELPGVAIYEEHTPEAAWAAVRVARAAEPDTAAYARVVSLVSSIETFAARATAAINGNRQAGRMEDVTVREKQPERWDVK